MLRISEGTMGSDSITFLIEGRVIGPWVVELRTFCERFLGKGYRLTLDLGDVSFVDRDGVAALRDLVSRKATLINCPLFLAEQLKNSGS
jgi:ABC-type transporter Mla MlaB component